MNRVIKFRYWSDGEMWPVSIINNCKHPAVANEIDFGNLTASMRLLPEETNIMQFTGLRDKNGKEIYEGDILRLYDDGESTEISHAEVKWREDCAGFGFLRSEDGDWADAYLEIEELVEDTEIIGNIYENPELI